jgi:hypothetical protein
MARTASVRHPGARAEPAGRGLGRTPSRRTSS